MRFFEHKLSLVILFFSIPLLFLPKINLISIDSNESAGLRIDDIILFFVAILLMWSHALSHQRLYKIEGWILLITAFSFVSFLSNRLLVSLNVLHMDAKIFYTVRLMEYFIFFYIGAMASQYFGCSSIVRAFFLWNFLIMTLQKMGLAGAVTVEGYYGDVSTRVLGVASFPSEMGLVLNLLFCYMIWDESAPSRFVNLFRAPLIRHLLRSFYLYWMFALFGIFVIFTGNRISIVALLVCFFARFFQKLKFRSMGSLVTLLVFIPLLLAGIGFLITKSEGVYERSSALFSFKNLELFTVVWDHIDITREPLGSEMDSTENYDMSWWIRIHKWLFAAKSYLSNPMCYLQGLGPGFAQAALDGGLLRILTEYGLIGAFIYWKFFACLYRLNSQTKWMSIAFLINMIFFDAYLAYKTMSFFFFTCGHIFETQRRTSLRLIMIRK
jgi:hypothetical protein